MRLAGLFGEFSAPPRFLVLGAFLFAGDMKASAFFSRLPVDLTLLTGSLLTLILLGRWAGGARAASAAGLGLTACWFLSFLPGLPGAVWTPYVLQKVGTLGTFSLLAALAPFVLVRGREDLRHLMNAVALFCLVIVLGGLLGGEEGAQRLEAAGGGTIALGRAGGFLFLFGAFLLSGEGPAPLLTLVVTAAAALATLFSGSRGPMGAAVAAVALTFAAARKGMPPQKLRLAVGAGTLAAALALSVTLAPQGSLRRTESFLRGEFGASEAFRAEAARASWARVGAAPLGLGWGGFAAQVDPGLGVGRQYPHNLLLEVTLEAGWLAGACTCLILAAGLGAAWAVSRGLEGRILLAGLGFWTINALVSGDVNDNRPLFTFLSAALCLWKPGGGSP
jgi:hypothetical protein